LIELAVTALVVMGAGTKINTALHMVQARLMGGGKLSEPIFPENNFPALVDQCFALLLSLFVFTGHPSQGSVKATNFAVIINFTGLAPDNTGLHPDAGRVTRFGLTFCLAGIHDTSSWCRQSS
jgi:hypothetical protein